MTLMMLNFDDDAKVKMDGNKIYNNNIKMRKKH